MPTMENEDDPTDSDEAAFARGRLVGDLLAAARGRSISKREAARRAGFSESQWRALEAGRRTEQGGRIVPMNPRPDTLAAACLAVGADMERVFEVAELEVPDDATLERLANPSLGDVLGAPGDALEARLRRIEDHLGIAADDAESDEIARRREVKRPASPKPARLAAKRGTPRKRSPSGTKKVPRGSAPESGGKS